MTSASIDLPASYESLNLTHIKISHHPTGTQAVTPVVIITLNRPEKHNAFTPQMADSLTTAYKMIHIDPRVKVVVLTGAGKMFCAGSDLDVGFGDGKGKAGDFRDIGGRVALAMHRYHKPTIAAMNGSAVGVGMTMTLPAAIRRKHGRKRQSASIFHEQGSNVAVSRVSRGGTSIGVKSISPYDWTTCRESQTWRMANGKLLTSHRDYKEGVNSFLEKRRPCFESDPAVMSSPNYPWWSEVAIAREPMASSNSKSKL
ncbi:Enoyl-CoA hydratase AKT3-1 [Penicillium angulare]|uniref:Enoyl-CoA hydratase AKT3-1 n=1 Tax=Penicillium angulare TaxID=116970 RepID=UPI00253FC3E3|nr:Enoyl-CoA hydratase AKT3-1 [Penicillium angulare]KAJ5259596.1 Enoyl-CoA hydratase AKT3-1 [Penicillium angulare]